VLDREREFWNARSHGSYDRVRGLISRAIGAFSSYGELESAYDPRGLEVLDYGCGRGEQAVALLERGAGRVTGFDLSEAEVAAARARVEANGYASRATFLVADAHRTGFPDASFDLVVGRSILHHLDVDVALAEIRRILRPSGTAVFVEPLAHNPLLRLGRRLTPSARTVDEHPFTEEDWARCAAAFPGFRHFERELVTIPLMPLNLALPPRAQQRLAVWAHRLDRRLMQRFPSLRKHARLTFLILQATR
jgi:ubiquinone/menaquinone biosynthesis C-methylase UbiE